MNALTVGLLVATTIGIPRITLDDDALVARYESDCTGGAAEAACAWMQRELEVRLLVDLQDLQQLEVPIDREVIRTAARAEFPFLAVVGLQLLERVDDPEDEAAVAWAMDHPSPGVRALARRLARDADRPRLRAILAWGGDGAAAATALEPDDSGDWPSALMPEPPRHLEELGLPEYAADYRPSMSDATLTVFTTPDPPARVLAVLAQGREVVDAAAFMERMTGAMAETDYSELEAIMEQMAQTTDPARIAELSQAMDAATAKMSQPMAGARIVHGTDGRYFELPMPGAASARPRIVGVERDATLGVTTIAVLAP